MATNHTENYALNLWEPEDAFLRTEFNENWEKLDAAIVAAVRKAETDLAAVEAVAEGKGNCRIITGSYRGNGRFGESNPTRIDFSRTLVPKPLVVFICTRDASMGITLVRGVDAVSTGALWTCPVTWTDTGVSLYHKDNATAQMNGETYTYDYYAIG